jgi:geranylgeranyl diphosphate synthase type I
MGAASLDLTGVIDRVRGDVRGAVLAAVPARWPTLAAVLEAALPDPPPAVIALPLGACAAAGGDVERALPAAAAWTALNLSLRLLDDLEDRDRDDAWWAVLGSARAHHVAAGLREVATALVVRAPAPPDVIVAALRDLGDALLRAGAGQDRDLAGTAADLDAAWRVIADKTGAVFTAACRLGVRLGGGRADALEPLSRFGHHLGAALQLVDDWESTLFEAGARDLHRCVRGIPIHAAAALADETQRAALEDVLAAPFWDVDRVTALLEATGARRYTLWMAEQERERARACLEGLDSAGADYLRRLCMQLVPLPGSGAVRLGRGSQER